MPPLQQVGIVGQDAVIAAIEPPRKLVRMRPPFVQRDRHDHRHREGVLAVHDVPGDDERQGAVRCYPAAHDLAVKLPPEHGIRLPQAVIAHVPHRHDLCTCRVYRADPNLDPDRVLRIVRVMDAEQHPTVVEFIGRCGATLANELWLLRRWIRFVRFLTVTIIVAVIATRR